MRTLRQFGDSSSTILLVVLVRLTVVSPVDEMLRFGFLVGNRSLSIRLIGIFCGGGGSMSRTPTDVGLPGGYQLD